jgi:hypothetical protein
MINTWAGSYELEAAFQMVLGLIEVTRITLRQAELPNRDVHFAGAHEYPSLIQAR